MEELKRRLEEALWAFYHVHIGTAMHLSSKKRCYQIADRLRNEYRMSNDELADICAKVM